MTKVTQAPRTGGSNVRPLRRPSTILLTASASSTSSATSRPKTSTVDWRTKKLARTEQDVQRLRDEVARLVQLREVLKQKVMNSVDASMGSPWRVVKTYFDVFQRGYVPPSIQDGSASHPDDFLASIMDEEVLGGGFHGVAFMIEQWKRYGASFINTRIDFVGADVTCVDPKTNLVTVVARANYSGHLTLNGIEGMFPHIVANPGLVMSLLGQRIAGQGKYIFVYDSVCKRVVECRIDIDLVSAYAKVVSRAADLEQLFGAALLSMEFYMGDDVPEPTKPLTPSEDHKKMVSPAPSTDQSVDHMSLGHILCDIETDESVEALASPHYHPTL